MAATVRPRRSVLYMPGSNTRALEKAKSLAADGLIFDLEDAVAPDVKEIARQNVMKTVHDGGYGRREVLVRVNSLATPWGYADIVAAAQSGADGVLVPKVESADGLRQVDAILTAQGAPDNLALWCMMETPRAILGAAEIAAASPRLAGFVMGTSDLAKELHAAHTAMRLPMLVSLGQCLLAARAHGLAILDGVYLDLKDQEGFEAACRQGQELGFDGKTLIHPDTIAIANRVFSPSDSDLTWSRKIIAAHSLAGGGGFGVLVVDGKLVEHLHVANAERLVALAAQIAQLER
jgi:citrate lyase subunit beta/citryl-CoA lyase